MSRYGEPWKIMKRHDERDYGVCGTTIACLVEDEELLNRAIHCVNAMEGLDTEKVRALIDDLLDSPGWCDGIRGIGDGQGCGSCWRCRARACREIEE